MLPWSAISQNSRYPSFQFRTKRVQKESHLHNSSYNFDTWWGILQKIREGPGTRPAVDKAKDSTSQNWPTSSASLEHRWIINHGQCWGWRGNHRWVAFRQIWRFWWDSALLCRWSTLTGPVSFYWTHPCWAWGWASSFLWNSLDGRAFPHKDGWCHRNTFHALGQTEHRFKESRIALVPQYKAGSAAYHPHFPPFLSSVPWYHICLPLCSDTPPTSSRCWCVLTWSICAKAWGLGHSRLPCRTYL